VAVLVDITEQKRLRQRVEAHRAELARVGQLALAAGIASSAAHQLSQPIAAISNYVGAAVRLQKQGRLGEGELFDILARVEGLATQAGETLDRLRALIRRRNQTAIPVDVNEVAESSLDFLGDRIARQSVRVERHYEKELPKASGEPIELAQVLIQLISNALEAMESAALSERRLLVRTGLDREAGVISIEIADTGPGVSPEFVEHLFEPWQTSKPNALGIGLSIAQMIVEGRKGRICMKPGPGVGAHFRVELPVGHEALS
jgi:C4-dicarboxylate-specific signal transduction histidine kinase